MNKALHIDSNLLWPHYLVPTIWLILSQYCAAFSEILDSSNHWSLWRYMVFLYSSLDLWRAPPLSEKHILHNPRATEKHFFSSLTFSSMISYKLNDSFYTLKVPTENIVKLLKEIEAWKISQWVKKLSCKYEDLSLDS